MSTYSIISRRIHQLMIISVIFFGSLSNLIASDHVHLDYDKLAVAKDVAKSIGLNPGRGDQIAYLIKNAVIPDHSYAAKDKGGSYFFTNDKAILAAIIKAAIENPDHSKADEGGFYITKTFSREEIQHFFNGVTAGTNGYDEEHLGYDKITRKSTHTVVVYFKTLDLQPSTGKFKQQGFNWNKGALFTAFPGQE